MKSGRYLTINAGDFQYLTGETNYTFPLQNGYIHLKLHSDIPVDLYLISSDGEQIFPLGSVTNVDRHYQVCGYDQLTIKCAKKAHLAYSLTSATKAALDPLDYEAVLIDAPIRDTEKLMMQRVLDQKLREMGIDVEKLVPSDENDTEDLDFFDEDGELPPTMYENFELQQNQQLEAELERIENTSEEQINPPQSQASEPPKEKEHLDSSKDELPPK